MAVEVVYDYIRKRHTLNREEFSALFPAPALLFERVAITRVGNLLTQTDIEAVSPAGTARFLEQFALRLRDEAHLLRLVRLAKDGTLTIGRIAGNNLVLASSSVSKHHAQIISDNARIMVADLGSRNGVFVDDKRIAARSSVQLHPGQTLRIASIPLRLLSGADIYRELETLTESTPAQA